MNISVEERILHFKKPARTSRGAYTEHRMFIVTVSDEVTGLTGEGECAPLPDLSCDRNCYPDADTVCRLAEEALASGEAAVYLRTYPALRFALESALMNMRRDAVLYDTSFARGREGIPFNGLIWMAGYEEMLSQVEAKIDAGFSCIKLKIGAIDWEDELRLLKLIRSRFSADTLQLRVDANGGFRPGNVMDRLDSLARLQVHSIEQPVPARWQMGETSDWETMARLCRNTPVPIALDEELIGVNEPDGRAELLDVIRPQYIVVKPTLHGGVSGTLEWTALAAERGIGSWITSALESNIGLRNVALLAARCYGPDVQFPQGLGTGLLFTDNVDRGVELRGNRLWLREDTI